MIFGPLIMSSEANKIALKVIDLQIKALKKLKILDDSFNKATKAILKCKSKL